MHFKRIVLVMAMHAEAKPIREQLKLQPVEKLHSKLPMDTYQGKVNDSEVFVVVNGIDPRFNIDSIGTTPAAVATLTAINQLQPDLIINAGTCGAFKSKGSEIAKVYWANNVMHHDRRISIPGMEEYGIGNYRCWTDDTLANKLKMDYATISTGNSLDMCDTDYTILEKQEVVVKEMEAGGIAYICELLDMPYMGIKSVTDLVDGGMLPADEFLINLKKSSEALKEKVLQVIDALSTEE